MSESIVRRGMKTDTPDPASIERVRVAAYQRSQDGIPNGTTCASRIKRIPGMH